MECFLFSFYVKDFLVILLLRIVSELCLISPRTREAENHAAAGKGGERALCCVQLCMQMRASSIVSRLTAGTRECSVREFLCRAVLPWGQHLFWHF